MRCDKQTRELPSYVNVLKVNDFHSAYLDMILFVNSIIIRKAFELLSVDSTFSLLENPVDNSFASMISIPNRVTIWRDILRREEWMLIISILAQNRDLSHS